MPQIAFVNGAYRPIRDAAVNIEDRGYQFADGVYEVCLVVNGRCWDQQRHLARLERSLSELKIKRPMTDASFAVIFREILKRNRLTSALLYLQVTRGVASRVHAFPDTDVEPTVVITAKRFDRDKYDLLATQGVRVTSLEDIRWGRVDIKSTSLLPNILARQTAAEGGSAEAWLVRNGAVTEGSASNAWIVDESGDIFTHPLGNSILGGVTRATVLECAEQLQIKVHERAFSLKEAMSAREAFITSATNMVMPVIAIDGRKVGTGAPGPISLRLRQAYVARMENNEA